MLLFPVVYDANAFDHENRDAMLRWRYEAKRSGFSFRADPETGDWIMRSSTGSEWADIWR